MIYIIAVLVGLSLAVWSYILLNTLDDIRNDVRKLRESLDNQKVEFEDGDKVLYVPENKIYDFGYISQTRCAVIYEQGERNMQDSIAVDLKDLRFVKEE